MKSLTSMRAFAALVVFLFHVHVPQLVHLTGQGRVGVSFFFLLSGLLLGMSYRPGLKAASFYRRRFARIYPSYLVALIFGLGVSLWIGSSLGKPYSGALAVLLVQSWVPDAATYGVWNPVSWSLSTEIFFYLLFPILAPFIIKASAYANAVIRIVCVASVLALGVWASIELPDSYLQPNSFVAWATYIAPIGRLAEFALGISLVGAVRGPVLPIPKSVVFILLGISYILAGFFPTGLGLSAITLIPMCLFLIRFAQADSAGESSFLHNNVLVRAGEVSYSFYLMHQVVIRGVGYLMPNGLFSGSILIVAFVCSCLLACLLYRVVEMPFDRYLNGRRP